MNSYKEFKNYLENMKEKKKLLLHSCCGGCSSGVLELLSKYFDITVYFANDNIYPKAEYEKRLIEQEIFLNKYDENIKMIKKDYEESLYNDQIKEFKHLGEFSLRCYSCYELRLRQTAKIAKEENYDFFTTTLSISPYKNSQWVNEIGQSLGKEYEIPFLYSDFKKEEGYKRSIRLSKDYEIYRQEYCGCKKSLEESIKRKERLDIESKSKEN